MILKNLLLIHFCSSLEEYDDEEIKLKENLFGSIYGRKRYDKEVLQNCWRKTVETDLENIGTLNCYYNLKQNSIQDRLSIKLVMFISQVLSMKVENIK